MPHHVALQWVLVSYTLPNRLNLSPFCCQSLHQSFSTVSGLQGLLVPLVEDRAGAWYPAKYKTGSNLRGVYGYKVFIAIALFLGDGLYNLVKIIILSVRNVIAQRKAKKSGLPVTAKTASECFFCHLTKQARP